MSDRENILDVDFDAQLQGLFQQAERAIGERASLTAKTPGAAAAEQDSSETLVIEEENISAPKRDGLIQLPASEATGHAADDLHVAIRGLDAMSQSIGNSVKELPKAVADLRALLEMKNGVSHGMFSALHEELKGYKDGFLLESVYRPIIRDLVAVYDDLTEIHRQVTEAITDGSGEADTSESASMMITRMRTLQMNLGHNLEFILEVLARLDVTQMPVGSDILDKCLQRAVAVEWAATPDEDTRVVRVVKRGFLWHERVFRPEEVVVKRFREEKRPSGPTASSNEETPPND